MVPYDLREEEDAKIYGLVRDLRRDVAPVQESKVQELRRRAHQLAQEMQGGVGVRWCELRIDAETSAECGV